MRFVNEREAVQVRVRDGPRGRYKWALLQKGETIELPESVGKAYGLTELKVTEGKIGKTKVETKQFEKLEDVYTPDDVFFKELTKIKGIGEKTAEDIVEWGTKEKLIEQIKLKVHLPFRDDVAAKLIGKYGK